MSAMPPLPLPRGMSEFGMLDGEKGGGEGSGSEEEVNKSYTNTRVVYLQGLGIYFGYNHN
ncbi:uncharacterized protein LAESUDRAFT_726387 [Laetiporus sulphureus 93-53]|uniref:Uncharacterized protein n=1 Tax=Laetiporus sulphureus 93-53 TaxID=1314785 RepID=A0A165E3Q0_9APHY|nr:uncharacterized protein LAESUDRAFT_726387 [Laetiporus sulphureus 93-53]KZT06193.1 hypothetical protein LAESUDRAFT_726387 [Laetiporus sulphureus 93-53]